MVHLTGGLVSPPASNNNTPLPFESTPISQVRINSPSGFVNPRHIYPPSELSANGDQIKCRGLREEDVRQLGSVETGFIPRSKTSSTASSIPGRSRKHSSASSLDGDRTIAVDFEKSPLESSEDNVACRLEAVLSGRTKDPVIHMEIDENEGQPIVGAQSKELLSGSSEDEEDGPADVVKPMESLSVSAEDGNKGSPAVRVKLKKSKQPHRNLMDLDVEDSDVEDSADSVKSKDLQPDSMSVDDEGDDAKISESNRNLDMQSPGQLGIPFEPRRSSRLGLTDDRPAVNYKLPQKPLNRKRKPASKKTVSVLSWLLIPKRLTYWHLVGL